MSPLSQLERAGAVIVIRDWLELGKLQPAKVILALLLAPKHALPLETVAEAIRPRHRERRPSDGVVGTTVCHAREALADIGCPDAIIRRANTIHMTAEAAARVFELLDSKRVAA